MWWGKFFADFTASIRLCVSMFRRSAGGRTCSGPMRAAGGRVRLPVLLRVCAHVGERVVTTDTGGGGRTCSGPLRAAGSGVRLPVLLRMCALVWVRVVTAGTVWGGGPALLPIAVSLFPAWVIATATFFSSVPFFAGIRLFPGSATCLAFASCSFLRSLL